VGGWLAGHELLSYTYSVNASFAAASAAALRCAVVRCGSAAAAGWGGENETHTAGIEGKRTTVRAPSVFPSRREACICGWRVLQ
jgi:hypothetical protein